MRADSRLIALKKGGDFAETFCVKFDDFVKSPSAALRFNFFMRSLRGEALRDLTP